MRIAWGVHGYGRGHAVRALAVVPVVARRHEVLVITGGDAAPLLAPFPMLRVPVLAFGYRGHRLSTFRTLAANASILSALALANGPVAEVEEALRRFRPDVVVSDSEPLVLRAAGRLGIPRIGFDHVRVIAWCRPAAPVGDALQLERDGMLLVPEDTAEQRLNARELVRLGAARWAPPGRLTAQVVRDFLAGL